MTENKSNIARRKVLQATGATIVAGGAFAPSAAAQASQNLIEVSPGECSLTITGVGPGEYTFSVTGPGTANPSSGTLSQNQSVVVTVSEEGNYTATAQRGSGAGIVSDSETVFVECSADPCAGLTGLERAQCEVENNPGQGNPGGS